MRCGKAIGTPWAWSTGGQRNRRSALVAKARSSASGDSNGRAASARSAAEMQFAATPRHAPVKWREAGGGVMIGELAVRFGRRQAIGNTKSIAAIGCLSRNGNGIRRRSSAQCLAN